MAKINELISEKEKELNVEVLAYGIDKSKDLHVLAEREFDGSHAVWTSHYTGKLDEPYFEFYNGKYDMNVANGVKELLRRSGSEADLFKTRPEIDLDVHVKGYENPLFNVDVKEVVGDNLMGDKPYLVSEMMGNFSRDVIVYGTDVEDALENHVKHGRETHGWEVSDLSEEELQEGNYYFANGEYPIDLDYTAIKEVEHQDVVNYFIQKEGAIAERDQIELDEHTGTWYVVGESVFREKVVYLLESEQYGDEASHLIVNKELDVLIDSDNGFSDLVYVEEKEPKNEKKTKKNEYER